MKRKDWKFRLAFGALLVGAVLKVTLVPNLQDTALYRPLKTGLSTLGWVLLIYLVYWYREQKRWEKATPEERRDMERASQDERNQFLWGRAAYFSWQVTLIAIAAAAVVLSALDCTAGVLSAGALFGVHVLSYFWKLSRLSQKF